MPGGFIIRNLTKVGKALDASGDRLSPADGPAAVDRLVAGGVVTLSVPFALGVAVAAMIPPDCDFYLISGAACAVVAMSLVVYCGQGDRLPVALTLYFALGFFCRSGAGITGGLHCCSPYSTYSLLKGWGAVCDSALSSLINMIGRVGFRGERTGPLLTALLTGRKDMLPPEVVSAFRRSGASHILALSGLHLGVLYGVFGKVLSVLGNSRPAAVTRSLVLVSACGFYCLMTGSSPSLVRAFLFVCINEFLHHQPGRRSTPASVLCLAMTVQLTVNPLVMESVGFQLSYLAMTGIALVYPGLSSWYTFLAPETSDPVSRGSCPASASDPVSRGSCPASASDPDSRLGVTKRGFDLVGRVWKSVALAVSCQIFTAPVVWWHFHTFPVYFIITNLLALPLTELLIVSGVACVALSGVFGIGGLFIGTLTEIVDRLSDILIFCLETIAQM